MKKQRYDFGCTGPTNNNANRSTRGGDQFFDSNLKPTRGLITGLSNRPATLSACFDLVAGCPELPPRFREIALFTQGGLALVTEIDPADRPADPEALAPILIAIRPVEAIEVAGWRNFVWVVRSVLALCGWVSLEPRDQHIDVDPLAYLLSAWRPHRTAADCEMLRNWQRQTPPH